MELRIFTEPQQGATYDDLLAVALRAEALGFGAFFRSDHYLAMGTDGLPGPSDAWITLAGLARDTSTIRLGTMMTSATFRHPGPLAISVANVDAMSGGRVELGIGAGWYEAEHTKYGIPFPSTGERFDRFEDNLAIITGLWAADGAFTYEGRHYSVVDSPALPKPTQPKPPILIGGLGKKRTPALTARYADEFNLPFVDEATTKAQFARVHAACEAVERDPADLVLSNALVLCVGEDESELDRRAAVIGRDKAELRENGLAGTPQEVVDKLAALPRPRRHPRLPPGPRPRRPRAPRPRGGRGRCPTWPDRLSLMTAGLTPSRPFGRLLTAMATAFHDDGSVDLDGTARIAAHLVDTGNDGVVVSGTTGESPTTTVEEDAEILRAVKDAVGDRATIVAGVGTNATAHSVELSRRAEKVGVDALLLVTPYYNKPGPAGMIHHFTEVARAADLPVMLYDVPGRTGQAIPPSVYEHLATHEAFTSVKHATGDPTATLALRQLGYAVYSGDDALVLGYLAHGAGGLVSVVGHVAGGPLGRVIDTFPTDPAAALAEFTTLVPAIQAVMGVTHYGATTAKAALELLGVLDNRNVRGPLVPLDDDEVADLRAGLAASQLL